MGGWGDGGGGEGGGDLGGTGAPAGGEHRAFWVCVLCVFVCVWGAGFRLQGLCIRLLTCLNSAKVGCPGGLTH